MIGSHIILWTGWIIYCFLHSALATSGIKKMITNGLNWKDATYRVAYNVLAFIGLVVLMYGQRIIESTSLFFQSRLSIISASCIAATGVVIMILCILKYFKQLSGLQGEETREELEVTGLHRFVRHPLYLGTFIFITGLFLFFPLLKNLGTVMIIIIYTLIAIRFEEKKLVLKFGTGYEEYQRKVPRIIPGIK